MGWSESPPFSCAATETAGDIIAKKMRNDVILPEQQLENIMMAVDWTTVKKLPNHPTATERDQRKFLSLIEVYIDDFIGVIHSTNKAHLLQFSRRILDGITKVFPPPKLSGSKIAHPVSEKKLFEDGIWDTLKETLG
jgi:lantibiotic modifying enzyme